MKKARLIEVAFLSTCLFGAGLYWCYHSWGDWFPEYEIGKCLKHKRSGRIYQLIEDRYSHATDVGVPARVLVSGVTIQGEHAVGSVERISVYDEALSLTSCP